MNIEEIKRITHNGSEEEKVSLRDYFKKYGNTYDKEVEVHEILVNTLLQLDKDEIIALSGIIGYPVFLRISLIPKIRHRFPLLQDGASLILLDEDNNILVQQRMDNGKYGFSGGCQELGEELTDVAIRECYEEAGLLLDKERIIDVCEVSGLSRRNSYPNGDVVVNNTALHIGYLSDCSGALRKDYESKQVFFKPLSFLDGLSDEEKHEKDFIEICRMYMNGEVPIIHQQLIPELELPEVGNMSFVDYLYLLSPEQSLVLAKKMGYLEFLNNSLDERIRDIFPRLVDKSVVMSVQEDRILVEEIDGKVMLPKRIQSVGESFEDLVASSFGISKEDIKLVFRMSGNKMYNRNTNEFINALVFEVTKELNETDTLSYRQVSEVIDKLSNEDKLYYEAYCEKMNESVKLKRTK